MKRNTYKFEINFDGSIDQAQEKLFTLRRIKSKFTKSKSDYTKEQAEKFEDNFYNAKLNALFDVVVCLMRDETFTKKNNPFNSVKGDELITYQVKICDAMAALDIEKISDNTALTVKYCDISCAIKKYVDRDADFARDVEILTDIVNFYHEYAQMT